MAVRRTAGPLRRGLRTVPGSWSLIAMRWLLIVAAGIPSWLLLRGTMGHGAALRPYFSDVQGPLPFGHLARLLGEIGPTAGIGIGLSTALALALQQILTPGALCWLDRQRHGERPQGPWRQVLAEGTPWIWTMLRITLIALVLAAAGVAALSLALSRVGLHGEAAGWSSVTLLITLPRLRWTLSAGWLLLVGAGAFWCRVIMTLDRRHRLRAAFPLVLRAWRRAIWSGPLFFILLTSLSQAALGVYLVWWRQHPPASSGAVALRSLIWILLLGATAFAWHWLLRSALLTYTSERMFDLRTRPDAPWFLLRRLLRRPLPGDDEGAPPPSGPVVLDSNLPLS